MVQSATLHPPKDEVEVSLHPPAAQLPLPRVCVASAANLRSTPLIDRLMKRTEMAAARPPETAREKKERQTMEERLGKDKGE